MNKPGPKPQFGEKMKPMLFSVDELTRRKVNALAQGECGGNISKAVRDAINRDYARYQRE